MGAVTFNKVSASLIPPVGKYPHSMWGQFRVVAGQVTFSNSYATGGDSLALTSTGLTEVRAMLIEAHIFNVNGFSVTLGGTASAPKLLAYDATATEVTNTTDLSGRGAIPVFLLGS